ncbi:nitroreductase family protein [Brevibacterium aurantiacum]|uniref:hypothetical protein n=1 Tax=Brevibacterium aurantiacum TaxID=273384 RepID=UPI0018686220|nr:hypothetical protein [Brevibacterium aurantiacum]
MMPITAPLIAELFAHAARSPSAHNTQPWIPHFAPATTPASPAEVHVAVDPARTLPFGDPNSQDLHLAMGCWVESFTIAAAEAGIDVSIGSVRGRGPALEIRLLLTALPDQPGASDLWPNFTSADLQHRQVDRGPMHRAEEPFASAFSAAERALAASGMASVEGTALVEVPHHLWETSLTRATRYSYSHADIFTETLEWLRFDRRATSYSEDGLSADCLQIPRSLAAVAARLNAARLRPWIGGLTSAALAPVEFVDSLRATVVRRTSRDRRSSAPASTDGPAPLHHLVLVKHATAHSAGAHSLARQEIELGRNLLRTWLLLDRHDLRVDVHSEIKDCPQTRSAVSDYLLHDHGLHALPVAAFSVGRSTTAVPRSSRRPVEPTHS